MGQKYQKVLHRIVESLVVNPVCREFVTAPEGPAGSLGIPGGPGERGVPSPPAGKERAGGGCPGWREGRRMSLVSVMRGLEGRGREGQGDGNQF